MGLREACGASALLLPRRTVRAFQRLTDLHDDGAAASAALQAGGLVRHSRVSDESQHSAVAKFARLLKWGCIILTVHGLQ